VKQKRKTKAIKDWLATREHPELEWKMLAFKGKELAPYPSNDFTAKNIVSKFGPNPICYLSGKKLDYKNASSYCLEHKIPPCRGGTNELDNLELCHPHVNLMKYDLSIGDFLNLCSCILIKNGYRVSPPDKFSS
jgi:hypothetical protein